MRDALASDDLASEGGADDRSPLPRDFGAYELVEEIGRGGMGVVYRARHKALGRMVAIKLVLGGQYSSEAALSRFRAEAAAVAELHHPGIVAVYDYGEHDGQPFLVMELVEGRTLASVCDGRPMEAGRGAGILRALAHAVAHAHERRILHRDLKPSNVLIDAADQPRITDYGLARRMDGPGAATVSDQMLGTPSYAAPEQVAGGADGSGRAVDIYGLGALFYHLLTGRPPFNAATQADTLRLVLEAEPPAPTVLNPALPRDLETICLKCLAKDPARRYPTAAALADDVQRFLDQRPIFARRPSMGYRIRKFTRRHRIGVAAVAGVVLAVGIGAALSLTGYLRAERQRMETEEARRQAETLATVLAKGDTVAAIVWHSEQAQGVEFVEKALRYYELLPPDARNTAIDRRHAEALELRAALWPTTPQSREAAKAAARAAVVLRQRIASENPDDDVAATDLIWAQYRESLTTHPAESPFPPEHFVEIARRLGELAARFPDRGRPRQAWATALGLYADAVASKSPDEALAAIARARALRDELDVMGYRGRETEDIDRLCLGAEGQALACKGHAQEAADSYQALLDLHTETLKLVPGDRGRRFNAGVIATLLSHQAAKADQLERACEAERIARGHFRMLLDRFPEDTDFLKCHAHAHLYEAIHLTSVDGHLNRARAAWRQRDLLFEPVKDAFRDGPGGVPYSRLVNIHNLARIAASDGDEAGARACLKEARRRLEQWQNAAAPDPPARRLDRIREMEFVCRDLIALRSWGELLDHVADMRVMIDAGLAEQPDEEELQVRSLMVGIYRGIALQGGGRSSEAVALLRAGIDGLPSLPDAAWVAGRGELEWIGTLALVEALADTGQRAEAYRRAWALLNRQGLMAGSHWVPNELRARLWVQLAGVLDPAEAPLRLACSERAMTLLTSPESQGRITRDGRAALEVAQRLSVEARAAMDAQSIEELAERLDGRAADVPELVDALLAADERAWGADSASSACFSELAREAQKAMRLRCEELVARRPGSAGARFLLARTYRMEAFVALALGAKVDLVRAALLDYDARLEPFASLQGYAGVTRIRALNRMHLAELAASCGDAALASTELAQARMRAESWLVTGALTGPQAHAWRVRLLQAEAWCAWWLRDWELLGAAARATVTEAEAGIAEGAESADLRAGQAVGMAFQALALHTAGLVSADVSVLVDCRRNLVEVARLDAFPGVRLLVSAVEDASIERLRSVGDARRARAGAERILRAVADLRPFAAERWSTDLRLARAQVQLAGLLDPREPYEELRRGELLDQAALLLSARRSEGRMPRDGMEVLAQIPYLRAPIVPEDRVFGVGDILVQVTP